ncbi:MAG TPA: diacylglycerol kinase family protein [Candidatus Limnocylindria bacterium]
MTGAAIFLNQGAGSARTDRVGRMVDLARRAMDADLHVAASRDPDEVEAWLSSEFARYDTVVVVGGDGSLRVGLNVASSFPDLTLGFIPGGFGNAAAHLLGYPSDPEGIVKVLAAADSRAVDLIEVDGRLSLFAGAGVDAEAAGRYARGGSSGILGWGLALAGTAGALVHRGQVEVIADDWSVHRGPFTMLVVSTTPFYGRGLKVNPGARPTAGRLSLRVYPGPLPGFLTETARWAAGAAPRARRVDATHVTLRSLDARPIPVQIDGDLIGSRDVWEFGLRREAVRLIGRWD